MAEAAATLEKKQDGFVDDIPEIVSTYEGYSRPPESEIYGRSLRSIHRLGAFMVDKSLPEIISCPEADQARVEFYTSVEEGFGTDMELGGGLEVRDFAFRPVSDGRVLAADLKTPVSAMTEAGLTCAVEAASKDKRFLPQLTRSRWDDKNAIIVDEMARGETAYNTRIVISPFPEEAAVQSGNAYWRNIGYVPHLKRGFVQLYHATEAGVVTGSLSFDGSDKQQLRDIFDQYGIEIPEEEITDNWLKYAVTVTLSEDEAKALATTIADQAGDPKYKKTTNTVDVTNKYRPIMDTVFNESYVHVCESLFIGRQTEGVTQLIHQLANKAQHFNQRYASALYKMRANKDEFTDDDSVVLHELLVYSTIEMMRALHLENTASRQNTDMNSEPLYLNPAYLKLVNSSSFQSILSGFGADGARNGRTYSACGLSISAGDSSQENGPQTAYGGNATRETTNNDPDNVECEYSGTFCYCCPYDNDGSPLPEPIEITAKRDKNGTAHCMRPGCGATLDKNGNGSKGEIYKRAMLKARQKQKVTA